MFLCILELSSTHYPRIHVRKVLVPGLSGITNIDKGKVPNVIATAPPPLGGYYLINASWGRAASKGMFFRFFVLPAIRYAPFEFKLANQTPTAGKN